MRSIVITFVAAVNCEHFCMLKRLITFRAPTFKNVTLLGNSSQREREQDSNEQD